MTERAFDRDELAALQYLTCDLITSPSNVGLQKEFLSRTLQFHAKHNQEVQILPREKRQVKQEIETFTTTEKEFNMQKLVHIMFVIVSLLMIAQISINIHKSVKLECEK